MKYKAEDIAELYNQVVLLLGAGNSPEECLKKLGAEAGGAPLDGALASIKEDLEGGKSLSDVIGARQDVFPGLPPSAASVEVGALKRTLAALADKELWLVPFRRKLTQYLLYPAVVMVIISVIVFGIMLFVVPIFEELYEGFGGSLPAPTEILISIGGVVNSLWFVLLALLAAAIYVLFKRKDIVHAIAAALPGFGPVIRRASVMEFTGHLGALMISGIPVVEAARASAASVTNLAYRVRLDAMVNGAADMGEVSRRLKDGGLISGRAAVVLSSCGASEAATELSEAAEQSRAVVTRDIEVFYETSSIILMILLGGIVGFIIIALYLPIFTLAGAL